MDIALFDQIGKNSNDVLLKKRLIKLLTIEASGIGIACIVARHFNVPFVFLKNQKSINIEAKCTLPRLVIYAQMQKSGYCIQEILNPEDRVLIIDDFLANGCTLQGLISIVNESGASVKRIRIIIEKDSKVEDRLSEISVIILSLCNC